MVVIDQILVNFRESLHYEQELNTYLSFLDGLRSDQVM